MQLNKKTLKFLIPIVAIVLVIAIAAIVILPRPNLEIKDIKSPTKLGVLMRYGLPHHGFSGDKWTYAHYCIEFYGTKVNVCEIDFKSKEIKFEIMDDSDYNRVAEKIKSKADFEKADVVEFKNQVVSEEYSYKDAKITMSSWYIIFEF